MSYQEFQKGYASGIWVVCNSKGNHILNFNYEDIICEFGDMRKTDSMENEDVWYEWKKDSSYWAHVRGEDTVYLNEKIDHPASFPGGIDELNKFLQERLVYPELAVELGIQGLVLVSFIIDKTGKVRNACLLLTSYPLIDKLVLDLINSMPEWNPGSHHGKLVNVEFGIPLNFN